MFELCGFLNNTAHLKEIVAVTSCEPRAHFKLPHISHTYTNNNPPSSSHSRLPAEFKHISQRWKRNQLGFPQ
jgi:hypothetical protein